MTSKNWLNENTQFIAERFPNCVTETEDGLKVDFELLQQELSGDVVSGSKERYRLEWPGKRQAMVNANLPTTKTLRPVREDSVDFDNTENLYIEGDNLEVLKILQESYLGKIKMIYIDPPYNTGKDFVYKDNFTQDSDEYKEESGQTDEYNRRLVSNPDTSGRYHSDWLSMMYPRLKLARNLLTEDGVMFISIDETEFPNIRKICDNIFGEDCFIANAIWRSKDNSNNDSKRFSLDHNHTLVYARNQDWQPQRIHDESKQSHFKNPDNDPMGPYFDGNPLNSPNYRENLVYDIVAPNGNIIKPPKNGWRWSRQVLNEKISSGEIRFNALQTNIKRRTYLVDTRGLPPSTLMINLEKTGHNRQAKYELLKVLPEDVFETPKPIKLINYLMELAKVNDDDVVLDFFSGSGTVGHAVFDANSRDGFNRRFVLVQLPEATTPDSNARKIGYESISSIGIERIRRAAAKIKEETGADIDYGFKVYCVDESNMEDVYYQPQTLDQRNMDMFASNIKADRTSEDLLTQVLLDWGLPLTLKTEKATIAGKEVFKVAGDSLYACFDEGLDEAFAKAVAAEKPLRLVVKDSAFVNDTAKVNVQQLLKQLSPNTELKVL